LKWISIDFKEEFKLEIMKQILTIGASLNLMNEDGNTPLHFAVQLKSPIVSLLIERKADLNLKNKLGNTPLMELFRSDGSLNYNMIEVAVLLLDSNCDAKISYYNSCITPMHKAIDKDSLWLRL